MLKWSTVKGLPDNVILFSPPLIPDNPRIALTFSILHPINPVIPSSLLYHYLCSHLAQTHSITLLTHALLHTLQLTLTAAALERGCAILAQATPLHLAEGPTVGGVTATFK